MKKNKKNQKNIKNEFSFDDIQSSIIDLLFLENKIDYKKKKNIKLSEDEYFFDTFLIKPSFMLRTIERRINTKEK